MNEQKAERGEKIQFIPGGWQFWFSLVCRAFFFVCGFALRHDHISTSITPASIM